MGQAHEHVFLAPLSLYNPRPITVRLKTEACAKVAISHQRIGCFIAMYNLSIAQRNHFDQLNFYRQLSFLSFEANYRISFYR